MFTNLAILGAPNCRVSSRGGDGRNLVGLELGCCKPEPGDQWSADVSFTGNPEVGKITIGRWENHGKSKEDGKTIGR